MHLPFLKGASMINKNMPPDFPPLPSGELSTQPTIFPPPRKAFMSASNSISCLIHRLHGPLHKGRAIPTHGGSSACDCARFPILHLWILFAETVDNNIITHAAKLRRVGVSTPLDIAKSGSDSTGKINGIIETGCINLRRAWGLGLRSSCIKVIEWEKK